MKRLAAGLACALCLLSAAPAFAQTAPPAARVELARQIVEAQGMRQSYGAQLRSMFRTLGAADSEPVQAAMVKALPQMLDVAINAYAKVYTEAELTDILAFYKSAGGKAMIAKQSELTQETLTGTMTLMPQIMASLGTP